MDMTIEQIITMGVALFTSVPLITGIGVFVTKGLLKRFTAQSSQSNDDLALKMLKAYEEKNERLEKIVARSNQELDKIHRKLTTLEAKIDDRKNKK